MRAQFLSDIIAIFWKNKHLKNNENTCSLMTGLNHRALGLEFNMIPSVVPEP